MTIEVDGHEPTDIGRFIGQVVDVDVKDLNTARWADYKWTGEVLPYWPKHDGTYHLERKTWGDMASGVEEIEEQLRAQHAHHPEAVLRLLIEGGAEPGNGRQMIVYSRASGRDVMTGRALGGSYKSLLGAIMGWQEFLEVLPWSTSYVSTAAIVVEQYQRDQKPMEERGTFQRYFKRIQWHPNPQVEKLIGMAARDDTVGVVMAERLIARFGTVWNLIHASPDTIAADVKGISKAGAVTMLRRMGRPDV